MLMPWKKPAQHATSSSIRQLSSAMTGSALWRIHPVHPFPIRGAQGLFDEFHAQAFQFRRVGDGLFGGPGGVGIDAEDRLVWRRNSRTMARSSAVPSLIL
jgi:hypothetical protein